jgi:hypothetical protein
MPNQTLPSKAIQTFSLRKKQSQFVYMVHMLIGWCYRHGYELTFAEAYRPPELAELYAKQGRGIKNSLHTERLAIDFNLFYNGVYQTSPVSYAPLHDYWDTIGGAKRIEKDMNHFSLLHNGLR